MVLTVFVEWRGVPLCRQAGNVPCSSIIAYICINTCIRHLSASMPASAISVHPCLYQASLCINTCIWHRCASMPVLGISVHQWMYWSGISLHQYLYLAYLHPCLYVASLCIHACIWHISVDPCLYTCIYSISADNPSLSVFVIATITVKHNS